MSLPEYHQSYDKLERLITEMGINPDTTKRLIDKLKENFILIDKEEANKIAIAMWNVQDVMLRAVYLDIKITEEQALEVLDSLENGHDAEHGITWTTIDMKLLDYKEN